MIYKDFHGVKLSALGLGCMRLPKAGPGDADIDEAATQEMVDYALAHGINYFDTAWGYHAGQSEVITGRCLSRHPRESYHLASKFPGYDLSNMDKVEEIFERQLEKTGATYFDFYLFHNVCELNIDAYLKHTEVRDYLVEQVKRGRIRHLGFSTHGEIPTMQCFLEAYGKDCEFCQIQLNWLDWKFQDAESKVELLRRWGLPVWVMEPLRGGKLVVGAQENGLTPARGATIEGIRPDMSVVEAAFRWLQSLPSVCVTLSGMSNMEQLQQNIEIFETDKPLSKSESAKLLSVASEIMADGTVPCTACRYCTTECPRKLDIPHLLALYNQMLSNENSDFISRMYVGALPENKRPSACAACGRCAYVCPQTINIPGVLHDFAQRLSAEA